MRFRGTSGFKSNEISENDLTGSRLNQFLMVFCSSGCLNTQRCFRLQVLKVQCNNVSEESTEKTTEY